MGGEFLTCAGLLDSAALKIPELLLVHEGHGNATTSRYGSRQDNAGEVQRSHQSDSLRDCISCLTGIRPHNSQLSVDRLAPISGEGGMRTDVSAGPMPSTG